MKQLYQLILFPVLVLISSCAQIVAPTGGDKDFNPPRVIQANPENKTTNFTRKKITVTFDEFIQLNTPEDLIIISPPLDVKPTYTNKGKSLEIKLNAPLQTNTTYTINLSTAVGDNKENNLLKDYNYVFSTGDHLDSGYISGTVSGAFNNKPQKDITVALYYPDSFTDSTIIKQKPVYVAKSDESGNFLISNLPSKQFIVTAFKDDNKNLKTEPTEEFAFIKKQVQLSDTNTKPVSLRLFKPDLYKPNYIIDTFNREPDKFSLLVYQPKNITIKNTSGDTLYINHSGLINNTDTFSVFTKMDSDTALNLIVNDKSVSIKYKPVLKAQKLSYSFNRQPELNDTIIIRFNNPVISADTSRIKLLKDSIPVYGSNIFSNPFEYRIVYKWEEKTSYTLILEDSAFTDFFDQPTKKDKVSFVTKTQKDYATLLLHVKISSKLKHPVILQLLNEAETEIFHTIYLNQSNDVFLDYVLPGNYKLKWIFDENDNMEWDNGNFSAKIQPEKVGYFNETINVKAYWDLEQSVLIE